MKFSYIGLVAAALAWPAAAAVAADANSAQHHPELSTRASPTCDGSGTIVDECKQYCGCGKSKNMNCQEPANLTTCKALCSC